MELNCGLGGPHFGMTELERSGLTDEVKVNIFELHTRLRECANGIAAFLVAWEDPANRTWLGAVINDWLAAEKAAKESGDHTLIRLTASRAERCRRLRIKELRAMVRKDVLTEQLLRALESVQAREVPRYFERALSRPTTLTVQTLVLIEDDPSYCPNVRRLFRQLLEHDSNRAEFWRDLCRMYLRRYGRHANGRGCV